MPNKRIPFFRFYPTDFMSGVRGLTAQEVGVYTMLLCRMYEESGPIEDHALRLATYCGMRVGTFEKTLDKLVDLGKIKRCDGRLFNDRAHEEISSRADDLKVASRAGKASAKKRQQKQSSDATTVQRPFNHTDTDTDKYSDTNVSDGQTVDFAKAIFERGVAFLCRHGQTERNARALVGRWRKGREDREVFDAFSACHRAGVTDPVPWIEARLKPQQQADLDSIFAALKEKTDDEQE